ncbi:hypothetical protein AB0I75_36730 [Streptomyces sp. NPDC050273]|uniref:hypothetical protein n=1 Tax=Streptomyces sp. NPDC050273 TaxID=3154933 RepID=UPI0034418694
MVLHYLVAADPTFLGDPALSWADLVTGSGGVDVVGQLLAAIAPRTPRADDPVPSDTGAPTAAHRK